MGFKLENVVPWGRSLSEYSAMFALTQADHQARILDCASGPSSFNAEMRRLGHRVVSCDPIYTFSAEDIARRIQETYPKMVEGAHAHKDNFRWDWFGSPERLGEIRMEAMRQFLEDFEPGRTEGRYVTGALPELPFADRVFDLALCSHFLFTYSDQFSADFHLAAIGEMCRVATEARIFPLLNAFSGEPSPHLPLVVRQLTGQGYRVETRQVDYEFQKGGNSLLCVSRNPE